MKNLTITLLGTCVLAYPLMADPTPPAPIGSLNVNLSMVRQGVAPQLTWKIQYPTKVEDVVDIPPDDTITPKTRLRVKVSMVGVGLTDQFGTQYPAQNLIKFGNAEWQQLFKGTGSGVDPNQVLVDRTLEPGETIRFGAKVDVSGYDYYFNDHQNVTVLKNGDTPPQVSAGYDDQTDVATYLRPYLKDGKIALGPMDVLYVSELTHSDTTNSGYDMQDSIVLIQFEKVAE